MLDHSSAYMNFNLHVQISKHSIYHLYLFAQVSKHYILFIYLHKSKSTPSSIILLFTRILKYSVLYHSSTYTALKALCFYSCLLAQISECYSSSSFLQFSQKQEPAVKLARMIVLKFYNKLVIVCFLMIVFYNEDRWLDHMLTNLKFW